MRWAGPFAARRHAGLPGGAGPVGAPLPASAPVPAARPALRTPAWQKRALDVAVAAPGLLLLSPVLLVTAALVAGSGPVFYRQTRVGQWGRPFRIWKFRTMAVQAAALPGTPHLTVGHDPRVTRVGRWLRATKIDELPQLLNVLRGDMSLVGPRPEVPHYVQLAPDVYGRALHLKPGITSVASLVYHDESGYLGQFGDAAERVFLEQVVPHKVELCVQYAAGATLWDDVVLMLRTALRMFRPPR
ncbi:sugar transferase [Deinococcus radiotolerans]|uniref:Bacterial sugar transferase domain-containing protein n=1 Tax=Deinococcus radiotolerans TaxID=1309407 RepID=A0ABQ2FLD6_9DEIO|nr:sugar transferase [Deinococcus radiotolerans]GGL09659.1 hypothetical protein GCM10010844_30430 [Deinococcus radiotolerans]